MRASRCLRCEGSAGSSEAAPILRAGLATFDALKQCGAQAGETLPADEELLFRRSVFTLLRRFPDWLPVTVSVALFAWLHPPRAHGGAFLLALATACLNLRSGSLLPGIACHAFANRLAVAGAIHEWPQ